MRSAKRSTLLVTLAAIAALAGLPAFASKEKPVIGFSIDDLRVERWTRDRDYFVESAKGLGAEVNVQSADANEQRQISQIENLIAKKVDAIVIVPFNSKVLTNTVREAKKAGIKVISYDRLILNADVDAYISFDNVRVGALQAEGIVRVVPKGAYYLLGGAPTDNNAKLLREGQMQILKPYIDRGDIKLLGDQWVKDWNPEEALKIIENVLTRNANKVDAIIASNDGTAGGAIQALAAQKLAGKVAVSGQDAELAAARRVLAGTQTLTVYKPIHEIAAGAAKLAVQLVKGEKPAYNAQLDNGAKKVDSVLLTPTIITKDNVNLLVTDKFFTKEQLGIK
ncbi:MAG: D-xylose ABC transporter substrate-binding protein [Candidatus Dactylopiibacterium carminicum]|nr:MAG: D-xylose ABC transporter substrate-binding protein [Candidatus Dactylopiibacterium carminicum]